VLWESGEKTWVEEEDMNCPQLLVEFTKTVATKTKLPHELLKTLIEALEGFTKEIQNPQCKLTNVGIKRKIKEFIGRGNPYLRSSRVVTFLEYQLAPLTTKDEFIKLLQNWTQNPNDTFAGE